MELPELNNRSRGKEVRRWQLFLVSQGIEMDFESNAGDGIFGIGTATGTKEYQSRKGLPVTGVVDAKTYAQALKDGFDMSNE